jgi:hypothetical protein
MRLHSFGLQRGLRNKHVATNLPYIVATVQDPFQSVENIGKFCLKYGVK